MKTASSPSRPRCSVFIATSVDGYIAREDGSIDWLGVVQAGTEDYGFAAFAGSVDGLVMGRRTYDTALAFDPWPYQGKRCIVVTHHAPRPRHAEEFFSGEPADLVRRLGEDGLRHLYVDGGQVIRQFFSARLVDDMVLSVIPVVLGSGIRLFEGGLPEAALVLEESRSFPTGLAQLRYRVRDTDGHR